MVATSAIACDAAMSWSDSSPGCSRKRLRAPIVSVRNRNGVEWMETYPRSRERAANNGRHGCREGCAERHATPVGRAQLCGGIVELPAIHRLASRGRGIRFLPVPFRVVVHELAAQLLPAGRRFGVTSLADIAKE